MAAVLPAVDARALRAAANGEGEGEERGSQRPTWKRPREERNMRDGRRETEERRNGTKGGIVGQSSQNLRRSPRRCPSEAREFCFSVGATTMPLELVLESLPARTDRPARIPVPSPPGVLFIRRMTPTAMAAANSTPTLWLNADDTSNHPQLLSRAHAELGWVSGVCTLFDGNPRDQKKSCNGSSVDGILVAARRVGSSKWAR